MNAKSSLLHVWFEEKLKEENNLKFDEFIM